LVPWCASRSKTITHRGSGFCSGLKRRNGKEKELPVHHKLEELLDEYLQAAGLGAEPGSLLFPAALGNTGKLSRRLLRHTDAADMLKRRLKQAGLPAHYPPHSFRATGITNFLENDGTLEAAQRIAGHADSRTAKLYARCGSKAFALGYGKGFAIDLKATKKTYTPRICCLHETNH
jgi:site-specific recombinase XerC